MTQFSALATPTATRAVLERFGLAPKKAFGQNFLVNDSVIGRILDLSEVSEADTVLEVGPGIGTLSSSMPGSSYRWSGMRLCWMCWSIRWLSCATVSS